MIFFSHHTVLRHVALGLSESCKKTPLDSAMERESDVLLQNWTLHSGDFDDFLIMFTQGTSLLESWGNTFLLNWQPPLIFVWFMSYFLYMCLYSMASVHVILK